ncbi:uncharacterized protein B0H18DRAFT_1116224 [Fomitopsis serialis]|uniref:uncharacterized protein n=1 Tax=Fomitopsis serialis TaxID=139415 RepID=UPI002007B7C3|nr:uncharacterized protein B0H18DRAFT_956501 [Neoantrodia serialis]XP_047896640.1 uncharacterized protein B0H18DRAFT_1116224 [Neoantrodia serialis]KAH9921764.1 hypothetical protein B0H18DRAFT_956501 [Neoantrodia serialis]KAH9931408.1 hypothetical protein B0H18DRAFT_1116224 [Neoantrodia serialis]
MMENLPIDTSHPAVRDYLALIRLQVLTPLSLLINIATVMVCSTILTPGLSEISKLYPATIAPNQSLISIYVTLVYIGQLGYCVLLVFARKPETKAAMVKGVGMPLVIANWVMAGWAIAWVLQAFVVATVAQGILFVLLLYANLVLLVYHRPTWSRPFDVLFIHAPVRAFMIWPFMIMFPYTLFVALGWTFSPGEPQHYARHQWPGFIIMLGVNLVGLLVVVIRRDVVWCISAAWMCASVWSRQPKPMPVWLTCVLFTIAHPLGLVVSWLWIRLRGRREGRIALPPDQDSQPQGNGQDQGRPGGPREVDAEALWG